MAGLWVGFGAGMTGFTEGVAANLTDFTPRVGESLEYKLILKSVIHGANQIVQITSKEEFEGRQVFNIRSRLVSVGIVKLANNYSEVEELKIDAGGFYPLWLRRVIRNGGKQQVEEVYFDYQKLAAERQITQDGGDAVKTTLKLPGVVQDGVSLPFFFRKGLGKSPNRIFFYSDGIISEVVCQITLGNDPICLKSGNYTDYYQFADPESNITIMIEGRGARVPFLTRMIAPFGKVESQLVKIQ